MNMFDTVTGLMPHGVCFFYRQDLILLHVISDALIALAYFSIPVTLLHFLRKRASIPFAHVLVLFAAFIMLCGFTHIMGIWTIWKPYYYLEGGVKVLTAAVSLLTAAALVPLVPKALAMRTPEELEAVNTQLREQIDRRDEAEQVTQQTLQQLETSNRELEQFAYVASHDLQAPLRSVKGFSSLLGKKYAEQLGDEGQEYIDLIEESAGNMQRLIDDLLALSRVDQVAAEPTDADVTETLDAALAQLDADIKSSGAQVTHDELPTLTTGHNLLLQVFQNLVSNGIKFQPPGQTPKVHISSARTREGWEFSVRDNGIGIPQDKLQSVFEIFTRLHGQGEYEGSGIGLALIQRIVKRLGGSVSIESTQGGKGSGTTVRFSLPERPASQPESAQERPGLTTSFGTA
ncbi:hypothetical protein GYB61_05630 [bacterium]|nr:hypothetical protein [bacterium]